MALTREDSWKICKTKSIKCFFADYSQAWWNVRIVLSAFRFLKQWNNFVSSSPWRKSAEKNLFYTHRTTYANKKDIRPEKPDFIGLFHVSEACPRAYKNVDLKRRFYHFSGKWTPEEQKNRQQNKLFLRHFKLMSATHNRKNLISEPIV